MPYLVVYPWVQSDKSVKYFAVVTDVPRNFPDAIFSEKFSESSEKKVTKKAKLKARKRGIAFVQGLD